jgi:thioredoxin 1
MVQETSDGSFKKDVLDSPLSVLVDFWAPWCGPCRIVGPIIDKVSEKVNGKARVFKLNVDDNPKTADRYDITSIPTVIVFRNGQMDKTFIGVQPEQVYMKALGI